MINKDEELAVLGALLSGQREMSGYEIAKASHLSAGALYPVLMRLERSNLVTSRWAGPHASRRRLYALAKQAMNDWQNISTAPKDGTFVLIYIPEYKATHIAGWCIHQDSSYPFAWMTQYGSVLVRGWKNDPEPTHWMPLPIPPKDIA